MSVVTMRQLLEAGIHFGHQTRRWNPKMERFIFGQRNGIYIIDLQKTMRQVRKAYACVRDTVAAGGTVLFVGTKKQAQEAVCREAQRCGMYYVNNRWLGGTLTNWRTIHRSIQSLLQLEDMESSGKIELYSKKEGIEMRRQIARLDKNLCGIKSMAGPPQVLFVIDAKKESIAVREAERLGIVSIGVVDTNCDPDVVTLPIPGNDDALRAVGLFCSVMADAVIEGRMLAGKAGAEEERAKRPTTRRGATGGGEESETADDENGAGSAADAAAPADEESETVTSKDVDESGEDMEF